MKRFRSRYSGYSATGNGFYQSSMNFVPLGNAYAPDSYAVDEHFPYLLSERWAGVHDVIGNRGAIDNPFDLVITAGNGLAIAFSFKGKVHVWSGSATDFVLTADTRFIGFTPDTDDSSDPYAIYLQAGDLPLPELEESQVQYITKMAARLNPSKPAVELGVNMAELAALPMYLFKAGRNLRKAVGKNPNRTVDWKQISPENPGSGYLALQYGWVPFVKDVKKLMKIVDAVERKFAKLRRLKENQYLRSSSRKFPQVYTQQTSQYVRDGLGALWDVTTVRSTTRWCTLYYTADTNTLFDTNPESLLLARRAAYGLNVDGSTMWQIMPWSWMFDWFGSFGEYIDTQRNSIGARLTSLLMETVETETTVSMVSPPSTEQILSSLWSFIPIDLEGAGYTILSGKPSYRTAGRRTRSVTKSRKVLAPAVEVDLALSPILESGYRSSIVGALAIQRLFR